MAGDDRDGMGKYTPGRMEEPILKFISIGYVRICRYTLPYGQPIVKWLFVLSVLTAES